MSMLQPIVIALAGMHLAYSADWVGETLLDSSATPGPRGVLAENELVPASIAPTDAPASETEDLGPILHSTSKAALDLYPESTAPDAFGMSPLPAAGQTVFRGRVFYDYSEDGIWNPLQNPLEVPLAGWRIELKQNGVLQEVAFSDINGDYAFTRDTDNSLYTFREAAPGGYIGDNESGAVWLATTAREFSAAASAATVPLPDSGNISFVLEVGLGLDVDFWGTHLAAKTLQQTDQAWRENLTYWNGSPLCLRRSISSYNPSVSIFKPLPPPATFKTAFLDFRQWLYGPSLDHAGYLLSVEVASCILNRRFGRMQFTVYVDRFQNGILVSLDDMITGAQKMLLCDPGAGMTGPLDPEQELRQLMLGCINEFGTINNSGDPAAPQTVFAPSRTAVLFSSPY